jgi:hypothetical protein
MIKLFGVILVLLITGSVQSVAADHLEPGKGIFKTRAEVETITTLDSNYQIYLQVVVRNADGQMLSVTENSYGGLIPHKITDYVFDTLMGEKEIITINKIKYEKVQYTFNPTLVQRTLDLYPIFEEIPIEYEVEEDALAQMKERINNYYRWKLHYCATFEGHEYTCIPVFQAFAVVDYVTPTDIITHQWTILKELN